MNYKLLLDTSNEYLSVGIADSNKIIYQISYKAWQRQSEYLIPEIIKGLESVNLTLKDIDEIVIGIGPGSYTGIRIAMTFAKTLGTITNIKVKAISSLAIQASAKEKYISVMNARSKRSYIGIFDNGKTILKDQILDNEKVLELINKYKEDGYKLYGETSYLNLESDGIDLINGLLTYSNIIDSVDDILKLKPIYLKDAL